MNIISGLLSGEKRQRSDLPTPGDPLETTVLAALQKFLPSCGDMASGHHGK
jgi:hypothetical protein